MPADAGDKTEAPTPRRREEARQKGHIPRSSDLTAATLIVGGILLLRWLGPALMQSLMAAMRGIPVPEGPAGAARVDLPMVVYYVGTAVLAAAGPVMLGLVLLAVASNLVQVGFLFTTEPLAPRLDRLDPAAGVRRLLNTRTLVQLAMNLAKLVAVGGVAFWAVAGRTDQILLALEADAWQQTAQLATIVYDVALRIGVALLVLALFDYAWQRWRYERDIRMTREEVREELRRMEGDPLVKQRRRKMQLVQILQQIRKNVPRADVVVTNPSELAVALRYDARTMHAPKVVAKGADYLAQRIREVAVAHGVPIVERRPLAQALYRMVEVGQEVPERFYKAIAEILAYVYQLSGKDRPRRVG